MVHLWYDIYKYKDISIVLLPNNNNNNNNNTIDKIASKLELAKSKEYFKNSKDILSNRASLKRYLEKIRGIININETNDGLILYYSGHGNKDGIILPNGDIYTTQHIMKVFDGEKSSYLINKPKIMIYDCCRGKNIAQSIKDVNPIATNLVKPQKTRGDWYDEYYHKNSGFATIFANFTGDKVNDSEYGGCLTRAIEQVFEDPNQILTFPLRDLILGIRQLTKENAGKGNKKYHCSAQLVDFHEAMEYNVYFKRNN